MITGEVVAGKFFRFAPATGLDTSRYWVINLSIPSVGAREMLHHIVSAPGGPEALVPTLVPQVVQALPANHTKRSGTPVVIIDQGVLRRFHYADPDTARGHPWAVNKLTVNALMAAFAKKAIVYVTADRTAIT